MYHYTNTRYYCVRIMCLLFSYRARSVLFIIYVIIMRLAYGNYVNIVCILRNHCMRIVLSLCYYYVRIY